MKESQSKAEKRIKELGVFAQIVGWLNVVVIIFLIPVWIAKNEFLANLLSYSYSDLAVNLSLALILIILGGRIRKGITQNTKKYTWVILGLTGLVGITSLLHAGKISIMIFLFAYSMYVLTFFKHVQTSNEEPKYRITGKKWILVILALLAITFIAFSVDFALYSINESIDTSIWNLLEALEQNDYVVAEEAVRVGADVNFTIAGRPILYNAVKDNDITEVNFLIKHGADVNSQTKHGRSPLHEAALYGHYDIAKLLIEGGANINARNPRGETPLFYAEEGLLIGPSHTNMHDKVAELLRSYGATR